MIVALLSADPDDLVRAAAKAAIDAGNVGRAMALQALLADESTARMVDTNDGRVIELATRRR